MNRSSENSSSRLDVSVASTRDLADLARAGYDILQRPFTRVNFEVHHTSDRPAYMRDNLLIGRNSTPSDSTAGNATPIAGESLVSAANGVGLVIGINTDADMVGEDARQGTHPPAFALVSDGPRRKVFRGTALPNPTFLFESAVTYEGIVSVEPGPGTIKFCQSIAVRDLIREISRIASDVAGAPILFLQAPAQLPAQSFIGQDIRNCKVRTARRSSSLAVRFAIALQKPSSRLRFQLTDILRQYCGDRGFGLWLADTRIGYRTGNWFQICLHADDLPRRERRERAVSPEAHIVEACLPITFIGPARIGSTYRIVSFLCAFSDIGIISCAITTLDDVAFIHVQLSVNNMRQSNLQEMNSRLVELASSPASPLDALVGIHHALMPFSKEAPDYIRASELSMHAGDYQTLIGPALDCPAPDRRKRIAVWFSWQVEGAGDGMAMPLEELFGCFSDMGLHSIGSGLDSVSLEIPNLEYLICRDIGNSVLRGRGKFSIPEADMLATFGGDGLEDAAVRLCVSLEDAWKASLRRHGSQGVSELTVAWREWWLGHWASPI